MSQEIAVRKIIYHEIDESQVTTNQKRMWILAAAGIGLNGYDLFIMSAALPLIQVYFGSFSPMMAGLLAGAAFLGAVPGALISGQLSDRFGRRAILLVDIAMLTFTSILCAIAWNPASLVFFRFLQGVAVGAEYPISASLVAEIMPRRTRGKWMTGAFSFQAVGMTTAAAISTLILFLVEKEIAWRWMMLSCAVPSCILAIMRRNIRESPRWLARKGRMKQAEDALGWLLGPEAVRSFHRKLAHAHITEEKEPKQGHFFELFQPKFRTRTILTTVPWFLMDIGLYGIGLFTPTILVALFHRNISYSGGFIASDFRADASVAIADVFLMIGFLLNIYSEERRGRIQLQILGFIGMAIGTGVVAIFGLKGSDLGLILGFSIFNLMVNFGPNATTYLLPVEVFPTQLRGTGHGFAAACGKVGATLGVFFLPTAAHAFGLTSILIIIGFLCMIGAIITLVCRVETQGMPLE